MSGDAMRLCNHYNDQAALMEEIEERARAYWEMTWRELGWLYVEEPCALDRWADDGGRA